MTVIATVVSWRGRRRAFTLVEVLVVAAILALLLAIMLPSLGRARAQARRTLCMANLRSLALAQATYAAGHQDRLVFAGEGSHDVQGSWIGLLEREAAHALVRRCPADASPHFETPYVDPPAPEVYRMTSYGINNYASPTHVPLGVTPIAKVTQLRRPASVVQFVELAEAGEYAVADHVHVQSFFSPLMPQQTLNRIARQMPIGRHGGRPLEWDGVLNYGFFDGHAESLPIRAVYRDPDWNRFNPAVAP